MKISAFFGFGENKELRMLAFYVLPSLTIYTSWDDNSGKRSYTMILAWLIFELSVCLEPA
jgi:hypothetical protein